MTINGHSHWSKSEIEVIDPATEAVFDVAPNASEELVELAVKSALTAFPEWAKDSDRRTLALRNCAIAIKLRRNSDD
jgi:acyl-CoA reductase-like NAD-dependent aldehyde dehydrogenase